MKAVVHNPGPGEPGYELRVTSARVDVRVNRVVVVCCCTFFTSSIACTQNRSNDQCDGDQCCPVLEEVYAGTTQEWSLRLDLTQHGETHQVLTCSKDSQVHSSFLLPRVVPRGRSQLVESLVFDSGHLHCVSPGCLWTNFRYFPTCRWISGLRSFLAVFTTRALGCFGGLFTGLTAEGSCPQGLGPRINCISRRVPG